MPSTVTDLQHFKNHKYDGASYHLILDTERMRWQVDGAGDSWKGSAQQAMEEAKAKEQRAVSQKRERIDVPVIWDTRVHSRHFAREVRVTGVHAKHGRVLSATKMEAGDIYHNTPEIMAALDEREKLRQRVADIEFALKPFHIQSCHAYGGGLNFSSDALVAAGEHAKAVKKIRDRSEEIAKQGFKPELEPFK